MTTQNQKPITILRLKDVESRIGLKRTAIYSRISAGTFPRQISLGNSRTVGWVEDEINNWLLCRINETRK